MEYMNKTRDELNDHSGTGRLGGGLQHCIEPLVGARLVCPQDDHQPFGRIFPGELRPGPEGRGP
eukprot:4335531-Lingulodinium_polyedra.AAC.1